MIVRIRPSVRSTSSLGRLGDGRRGEPVGRGDRVVHAVGGRPLVDGVEQAAELEVGELALVPQRPGDLRPTVADTREPADHLHADAHERVEVVGGPLGGAGELHRGHPASPHEVVHLVVALVEHAGRVHPPVDVATPVHAGSSHVLTDRQGDRPARALELVGDLHAAGRRSHHQHAPLGQLVGVPVARRGERVDRRRHGVGERRHAREVERPRRQHHGEAVPHALVRRDAVPAVGAAHRRHRRAGLHRGGDLRWRSRR